jgi:hypothetical protein
MASTQANNKKDSALREGCDEGISTSRMPDDLTSQRPNSRFRLHCDDDLSRE